MNDNEKAFVSLVESIKDNCSPERTKHILSFLMDERIKEGLLVSPASSSKAYHHCFEGGLLHHINQMIKIALCMRECGNPISERITSENLITVILLHDLHKICDPYGNSYYITNMLKSGKVSESKPFKISDEAKEQVKMEDSADKALNYYVVNSKIKPSGHLSLMTLVNYSPDLYEHLTDDEKQAIVFHGGAYETSSFELAGKENMLQIILHAVDMLSSRYHADDW